MVQLASVHDIDGCRTVERVVTELAEDIRAGRLHPGQELRLGELAARHGVRVHSLQTLCAGLERERLLTLRGQVAIVSPLDLHEVRSIYQLLEALEPELIIRASGRATARDLQRLRAMIPEHTADWNAAATAVMDFFTELCRPTAVAVDLGIYAEARRNVHRYLSFGFQVVQGGSVPGVTRAEEDADRNAMCHHLLDVYSWGRATSIRAAVLEFRRRGRQIAELSLDSGHPSGPTLRLC